MANPNPIFVSPSTTIVQVNPLLSPYTSVLLNSYSYAGQVVTVLDGTSSFGVLTEPIVVSTVSTSQFADGSVSTLINQPQGFLTVQAAATNTWSVLNSFPFRNQSLSAGTQNLTVSSLYAAVLSTIQETTASMIVEKLFVSGNFSQSSALTLNQTVSSLGSVDLYSTIRVFQGTFFSSALSTLGAVSLFSSLTVGGDLITQSTVQTLSSFYVSTSVSVVGTLSTAVLNLSDSLFTYRLITQASTIDSVDVAASLQVGSLFQTLSSLNSGSNLVTQFTSAGNLSTLSSFATEGSIVVSQTTLFQSTLSTLGKFVVRGLLSTGAEVTVAHPVQIGGNLVVQGSTLVSGGLSTGTLGSETMFVGGQFQVLEPTPSRVETLVVENTLGVGSLEGVSTTIGGTLSTPTSVFLQGSVYGEGYYEGSQELSVLSSFSTLGNLNVLGSYSSFSGTVVNSLATFQDGLTVQRSYWNTSNLGGINIDGALLVQGNLTLTDTLILSSIVLPQNTLANNFYTSTLRAGYQGIVDTVFISTLRASTLGTGGILFPQTTMDMSNQLQTYTLSTVLLSSFEFRAQSEGSFVPSTFFQATSSFGVQSSAPSNTFVIGPTAYTLSNTYVYKEISSQSIVASLLTGTLSGDGRLLSNVLWPANISTFSLLTSSIVAQGITASSLFTSTITTIEFQPLSTLVAGSFAIYGAASRAVLLSTSFLTAQAGASNGLVLNNATILGDTTGVATKQVFINANLMNTQTLSSYTLAVGNTLRATGIQSPNFVIGIRQYTGDIVVTPLFSSQSLYVSSGNIGQTPGRLFIPEGTVIPTRSTNTIETSFSTLIFNSTLFVNREKRAVGVNTFPFYTLDVKGTAFINTLVTDPSTIVSNQISFFNALQNNPSFAVGTPGELPIGDVLYERQVKFYNNPTEDFFSNPTNVTPFVAYGPSSFQLNKAMTLDPYNNILVGTSGDYSQYESTFVQQTSSVVFGTVSTQQFLSQKGLFFEIQNY